MASLRVDKGIIEMLLNHATTAGRGGLVASIYNRHSYDIEKRDATDKLAAYIRELADKGTGAVLAFPKSTNRPAASDRPAGVKGRTSNTFF